MFNLLKIFMMKVIKKIVRAYFEQCSHVYE